MKEVDDTPVPESEYEHCEQAEHLARFVNKMLDNLRDHSSVCQERIEALEAEVADLHHRRRVSRQQVVDQDPEWYS